MKRHIYFTAFESRHHGFLLNKINKKLVQQCLDREEEENEGVIVCRTRRTNKLKFDKDNISYDVEGIENHDDVHAWELNDVELIYNSESKKYLLHFLKKETKNPLSRNFKKPLKSKF